MCDEERRAYLRKPSQTGMIFTEWLAWQLTLKWKETIIAAALLAHQQKTLGRSRATDGLDRRIIQILQQDGRASHARMARELAVSEGTVRRRLDRLLKQKAIKVVAFAEPEQLGFHTSAFIGLQVDPAKIEAIAEQLAKLSETEHVAITTGTYDIFTWVNLASSEALAEFLHTKVGTIRGVRHTETFVSLQIKKRAVGPTPNRMLQG